jgi:hypothetical protein
MQRIIDRAIDRLKTQGPTPLSPCAVSDEGIIQLCTAAAVASAGLELRHGVSASMIFEETLATTRDTTALYETFALLSLPRALCETMKIYNDSVPSATRQDAVVKFLDSLPAII